MSISAGALSPGSSTATGSISLRSSSLLSPSKYTARMPARDSGLPVSLRATTSSLGLAELPLPTSTWRGSSSLSPSTGMVRSTAATTRCEPDAARVSALRLPRNTPTTLKSSTAPTAMPTPCRPCAS